MIRLFESLGLLLGRAPAKPTSDDMSADFRDLLAFKKSPAERQRRKEAIREEREHEVVSHKWRIRRWASIVFISLIFVVSYHLDVQMVEGALTAARVLGFHFADLNSSLQVMLAHKEVVVNLLIGTATVFLIYLVLGGRAFCAWVCPYHLLSEWAEMLHLRLAARGWVKDHEVHRGTRTVLFGVFAVLAFVSGYTVFETVNPVGIVSRAVTYGTVGGLAWVGLLLALEVAWSRRFWCRYVCPIGLTYGIAGIVAPVRIRHDARQCLHEGKCRQVCLVPHVLEMTKLGFGRDVVTSIGADCTRCGMCVDVCPTGALAFSMAGVSKPEGESAEEASA